MTLLPSIATMTRQLVILALSSFLCLGRSAVEAATTQASVTVGNATATNDTTTVPQFRVDLAHEASSTSSITVKWHIPAIYEPHIHEYIVKARKKNSDSILRSPSIVASERLYEVADLLTDCSYEICIYAYFKEGYEKNSTEFEVVCKELDTLALIRNDSLFALLAAIGYILLMILIGYLCWRCARRRSRAAGDASENGEEQEELLEKRDNSGQQLLAPPPQGRPRSSIEEELPYIPYITPPLEELEREKAGKPSSDYSGAANNI